MMNIIAGIGLLYLGGWYSVKVSIFTPFLLQEQIGGVLILDSLIFFTRGLGIIINNNFYGLEFAGRFFYMPLASWVLFVVGVLLIFNWVFADKEKFIEDTVKDSEEWLKNHEEKEMQKKRSNKEK